jgi:general secretion pathway protein H
LAAQVFGTKRSAAKARGFTLLEMIVVLLIIATMATLLGTSIVGRLDSVKVSTAARDLTAALRYTRSQAILHREEKYLEVDLEGKTYLAPGRGPVEFPESMELKLLTAQSEVTSDKVGRIRFFSDGGSTGGRVTLISGGREWKVKVSWLTGEIEMDDGRGERRS